MDDLPALRAATQGVSAISHRRGEETLSGDETLAAHTDETASVIEAARHSGVPRFIYVSRLGADAASAYELFRVRGEAEAMVVQSGLDYTVLQSAITYGADDAFTNVVAMIVKSVPGILPIPDPGLARFQPLWVGDLARCVATAVTREATIGATISLGGPEHFTLEQMVSELLDVLEVRRMALHLRMPFARAASSIFDVLVPRNPIPLWMLDIIEKGCATDLGSVPRNFGFEPIRFSRGLDYLRRRRAWGGELLHFLFDVP
jgi:NADH dehydrogenase